MKTIYSVCIFLTCLQPLQAQHCILFGDTSVKTNGLVLADIVTQPGGDAVVVGSADKILPGYQYEPKDVYVAKFGRTTGNLLWSKALGGKYYDNAYAVLSAPDGGTYLGAIRRDTNTLLRNELALYKLDSNGNVSWNTRFAFDGLTCIENISDMAVLKNGDILLTGRVELYNLGMYLGSRIYIARLEADGDIAYLNYIPSDTLNFLYDRPKTVTTMPDSGYIITGDYHKDFSYFDGLLFIARFSKDNALLYFKTHYILPTTLNAMLDGNGVLITLATNYNEDYILRFDPQTGALISGYGFYPPTRFIDLDTLSNGNFVLITTKYNFVMKQHQDMIVEMEPNGTVVRQRKLPINAYSSLISIYDNYLWTASNYLEARKYNREILLVHFDYAKGNCCLFDTSITMTVVPVLGNIDSSITPSFTTSYSIFHGNSESVWGVKRDTCFNYTNQYSSLKTSRSLKVYPNPSLGQVEVQLPAQCSALKVINCMGQVVEVIPVSTQQNSLAHLFGPPTSLRLNLSTLPAGLYTFTATDTDSQPLGHQRVLLH